MREPEGKSACGRSTRAARVWNGAGRPDSAPLGPGAVPARSSGGCADVTLMSSLGGQAGEDQEEGAQ